MTRPAITVSTRYRPMAAMAVTAALLVAACQTQRITELPADAAAIYPQVADLTLPVNCLLPGQVRRLGGEITYLTPRRPAITSANDCELRGGDYVQFDRADYETALQVWLVEARKGDARAQTFVGEIYARGLGAEPDYELACRWYRKAAAQGFARAQVQLGLLYEKGLGVKQDRVVALSWYRKAAGADNLSLTVESGSAQEQTDQASFKTAPAAKPTPAGPQGPTLEVYGVYDPQAANAPLRPSIGALASANAIVGRVSAPAGISSVTVNGRDIAVDDHGAFRMDIIPDDPSRPIEIVATDNRGRKANVDFYASLNDFEGDMVSYAQ